MTIPAVSEGDRVMVRCPETQRHMFDRIAVTVDIIAAPDMSHATSRIRLASGGLLQVRRFDEDKPNDVILRFGRAGSRAGVLF